MDRDSILEEAAWAAHSAIFDRAMAHGPHSPASEYSFDAVAAIRALRDKPHDLAEIQRLRKEGE